MISQAWGAALTLSPHADFEAFLEAAVLALIAVVLIHGAVSVPPAAVGQVAAHGALEEALAALTGELAVVLAARLVSAHHAVHAGQLVRAERVVTRRGRGRRGRGAAGLLAAQLQLRAGVGCDALLPLVYYHCHAIP